MSYLELKNDYSPSAGVSLSYRSFCPSGFDSSVRFDAIDFNDEITCLYVMSKIKGQWLSKDRRIVRIISDRVRHKVSKLAANDLIINQAYFYLISGGLFHSLVLSSLRSDSSLAELNELQTHCLLCAWVIGKGEHKVFSAVNLQFYKGANLDMINIELVNLLNAGLIDKLSEIEIHRLTNKVIKNKKRRDLFYKISKRGTAMLKDYFAEYERVYEKIMNSKFTTDLLTSLDTPDNKEAEQI